MDSDIMGSILLRLDREMCLEKCKVFLFWDNATCHPESLQSSLTNIKLVFLPKNIISRLQPRDAGIIPNVKHKYRKLLVHQKATPFSKSTTGRLLLIIEHLFYRTVSVATSEI